MKSAGRVAIAMAATLSPPDTITAFNAACDAGIDLDGYYRMASRTMSTVKWRCFIVAILR